MSSASDRAARYEDDSDRERRQRLAVLLERWEDAEAEGRSPTPTEIACDSTDLLSDFERLLRKLGKINAALQGEPVGAASIEDFMASFQQDRYRLTGQLGAGGQAWVFEAEDRELGRRVAVKCLQPHMAASPTACARFRREAELTSRLEHPGILPIHGVGESPPGSPYYVMRKIREPTLHEEIQRFHRGAADRDPDEQRRQLHRLLGIFKAVCETVAYAHSRGVIHRDLKPENIKVGAYGSTFVIDWGLAKLLDDAGPAATVDSGMETFRQRLVASPTATFLGVAKGTPAFMSPEQARGEWDVVGPASDIYSLGATLYVLLTGQVPFLATSSDADQRRRDVLERVKAGEPPIPPRKLVPGVPAVLEAICLKAMSKEPQDRYATADALAADIQRYLDDQPVSCRREPLAVRARRWLKRHRTLAMATAAALVVALIATGIVAFDEHQAAIELRAANTREQAATAQANKNAAGANDKADRLAALNQQLEGSLYRAGIWLAERAIAQSDIAAADAALQRCPAHLRGPEYHFLCRIAHGEQQTLVNYGAGVRLLALSPDNKWLAAAGTNGTVRLFDLKSGQVRRVFCPDEPARPANAVALSPDGRRLAVAYSRQVAFGKFVNGVVEVRNVDDGTLAWKLDTGEEEPAAVAFRAAGKEVIVALLGAAGDKVSPPVDRLAVYEAGNGHQVRVVQCDLPELPVNAAVISANGQRVAWYQNFSLAFQRGPQNALADSGINVWDISSGKQLCKLRMTSAVNGIAFESSGSRFAVIADFVRVFTAEGKQLLAPSSQPNHPSALALDPQGWFVAVVGEDRAIRICDAWLGMEKAVLRGHDERVSALAVSADGTQLVSGGDIGTIKLWSVSRPVPAVHTQRDIGAVRRTYGNRFSASLGSPDGGWEFMPRPAGEDGVSLRNTKTGAKVAVLARSDEPGPAAFSPDSTLLAVAVKPKTVVLWDVKQARKLQTLSDRETNVSDLAFSPDGKNIAVVCGGDIHIWSLATGKIALTLRGYNSPMDRIAYNGDGTRLAASADMLSFTGQRPSIKLWDTTSGEPLVKLGADGPRLGLVCSMAFGPHDDALIAVTESFAEHNVFIWDMSPRGAGRNEAAR